MLKMMIVHSSIWCRAGFSIGGQMTCVQGLPSPGTQTGLAHVVGCTL